MGRPPFHDPNGVFVGRDVDGHEYTVDAESIARYSAGTGDNQPWYTGESPFGGAVAPGLLYHSEVYMNLGWYLPNIFGNLHARQEWDLFQPMSLGQKIRTRSTVVERYRKRDRDYVVNEVLITDTDGRWLQRSRTHQSFLATEARGEIVVDREREKRADRTFTVGEGPGEEVAPLTRTITHAMCEAFSGPEKNYHTDQEMARALGFPDIVVQGMLSVCFAAELMAHSFGLGWHLAGKLDVRLVNVVWPNDTLTTRGKVREEVAEGSRRRALLERTIAATPRPAPSGIAKAAWGSS